VLGLLAMRGLEVSRITITAKKNKTNGIKVVIREDEKRDPTDIVGSAEDVLIFNFDSVRRDFDSVPPPQLKWNNSLAREEMDAYLKRELQLQNLPRRADMMAWQKLFQPSNNRNKRP